VGSENSQQTIPVYFASNHAQNYSQPSRGGIQLPYRPNTIDA
jgi:hypothetical protein